MCVCVCVCVCFVFSHLYASLLVDTSMELQVQEVVLLAAFQCAECQKRVADIISRMNGKFFFLVAFDCSIANGCHGFKP